MKKNCEDLIRRERENWRQQEHGRAPRIPQGLEEMLRTIYEWCVDHRPMNILMYIARKLESKLNQRTLSDNVDLDFYYFENEDDEYFKDFKGESKHEEGDVKTTKSLFDDISTEMLMKAYHNREPKYYEVIEDLIEFNLFNSLYDACRVGGNFCRKKISKCFDKPFGSNGIQSKRQTTSELAWSVNGDRSIYDPKDTPLEHFLKAHPEYIQDLLFKKKIRKQQKPCEKVIPIPYWLRKKPKKKQILKTDQRVKESTSTEGNVSAGLSEIDVDRSEDLKYLAILIHCYAEILDKTAEFAQHSSPDAQDDDQANDREDVAVQTDYCTACASHSLIDGVEFFSPTCLYMLNKGVGLNNPCWSCMSSRAFVKLDWKEFLRRFVITPSPSGVRNWMDCPDFLENVKFEEWDEPDEADVFVLCDEEPYDEAIEPSEPDPVPQEVFWSEEDQEFVISLKSKLTKFKWEAQTREGVPDKPDEIPVLTRLNIYLPPREDPSVGAEPDQPGEFPEDMIVTLHPLETVALNDTPDQPNKLRKLHG